MDSEKRTQKVVSKIIKAEMAKRGINYSELVTKLAEQSVYIKVDDLRGRISRGTFSATLFVQCLRAIGVKSLALEDSYFEET